MYSIYRIKHLLALMTLSALSADVMAQDGPPVVSEHWQNYLEAREKNSSFQLDKKSFYRDKSYSADDVLPNFSFAGYKFGEEPLPTHNLDIGYPASVPEFDPSLTGHKIFNVLDYGAIPNDTNSDKEALRATIAAASEYIDNNAIYGENSVGAIIYFPAGLFLVNEPSDMVGVAESQPTGQGNDADRIFAQAHQPIVIDRSNIILRGAGKGQTVLYMREHFRAPYSNLMWTTPSLFQVGVSREWQPRSGTASSPAQHKLSQPNYITRAKDSVLRESSDSLKVESVDDLYVGQWVTLRSLDTRDDAIAEAMSPYMPEPWFLADGTSHQAGLNRGLSRIERKQIKQIIGKRVVFHSPIHATIEKAKNAEAEGHGWGLEEDLQPMQFFGMEDLTLEGAWNEDFVHHKNYIHDSGWTALRMNRVSHSWVKNVEFKSFNQGLTINGAAITVQDVDFTGKAGHSSLAIERSTNVLAINIDDRADTWHGPGYANHASANVILNANMTPTAGPNIHASFPRANLFDKLKGGFITGRWGGSVGSQPNHLKHLVFWNPNNTAASKENFQFMQAGSKFGRIVTPYVIGMHGNPHTFEKQQNYVDFAINEYFTNGAEIPNFDELHPKCREVRDEDDDDYCDSPADDGSTVITYTLDGAGTAIFPPLANPYLYSNTDYSQSQAIEESIGRPVKPYSLYEAQVAQRFGELPEWLVEVTGKVRYVRFVAESGIDGAEANIVVLDQMGFPIEGASKTMVADSYPNETIFDLGDYYEPAGLQFGQDVEDDNRVTSFSVYTAKTSGDWQSADATGSFGNSNHIQNIQIGKREIARASAIASESSVSNNPNNILDRNDGTHWSGGEDAYISIDLQDVLNLSGIKLAFLNGVNSAYSFTLEYSLDHQVWETVSFANGQASAENSMATNALEEFEFDLPIDARYIKITGISSVNAYTQFEAVLKRDPVLSLHLSINEGEGNTTQDLSGRGNHGELQNFVPDVVVPDPEIEEVNGLIFDGIDDRVVLRDIQYDIDTNGDANYTVAAWIKFKNQTSSTFPISKSRWHGGNPFYFMATSDGKIGVRINSKGPLISGYADDEWHHVAGVLSGKTLSVYINGELKASEVVEPQSNSQALSIGDSAVSGPAFKGGLDDVRVYNNRALTAAEIAELAMTREPTDMTCELVSEPGLEVLLRLDDADDANPESSLTTCNSAFDEVFSLENGAMWIAPVPASGINGVTFDGVDDRVEVGDIQYDIDADGNAKYSVSTWIKFAPQSKTSFPFSKSRWHGGNPFYVMAGSDGKIGARVNGKGLLVSGYADDEWHHLAATLDGKTLKLYMNGEFKGEEVVEPKSNGNLVSIGDSAVPANPFKGSLDDLRIYNNVALDEATIASHAAERTFAGAPCEIVDEPALSVFLRFEDADPSAVDAPLTSCDASGNGYHGMFFNGAQWAGELPDVPIQTNGWQSDSDGSYLNFDGEDDIVVLPNIPYGNINNEYSVSMWVRYAPQGDNYMFKRVSKWTGNSPFTIQGIGNDVRAGIRNNFITVADKADSEWHHLVAVLKGTSLKFYVDDVLEGEIEVEPLNDNGPTSLGGPAADVGFRMYSGDIDEVRVYQYALTSTEASELYNLGR